jgi:adenylosuccinate synthase
MRIALAIPLLLLGACNVTKDGNSVTVQYDQNTAQNTAADIGNTAQNIGADIANDVQKTGAKIENKVDNTDVSVKINKNEQTNSQSGETTTTTKTTKTEKSH